LISSFRRFTDYFIPSAKTGSATACLILCDSLICYNIDRQVCVQLPSIRHLHSWHRDTGRIRWWAPVMHQIRSISIAGTALSSKPTAAECGSRRRWDRRTDRQTEWRTEWRTDARQFHTAWPSSDAYYKTVSIIDFLSFELRHIVKLAPIQ